MYFVPLTRALPIFGQIAAERGLWTLDISPGFVGQGIITGPVIPLHMLAGSVVGWGIMSPISQRRGWAPGKVDDWENGVRGWIIWISLLVLMADSFVKLSFFLLRPLQTIYPWRALAHTFLNHMYLARNFVANDSTSQAYIRVPSAAIAETQAYDGEDLDGTNSNTEHDATNQTDQCSSAPFYSPFSHPLAMCFGFSITFCTFSVHYVFGSIIPWYYTLLAIALSLPMAVVGIRSLAEADYNPESGLGKNDTPLRNHYLCLPLTFAA